MDDEIEEVIFIRDYIANTSAFLMNIDPGDTEQDCSAVKGSSRFYEYR